MPDFKMVERVFAHASEVGRVEQDEIIRHCLWSQNKDSLLGWLKDTPDDQVLIHIAGDEAIPVVLEVDPDGPIAVAQGQSVREEFALPDEEIAFILQISKPEAIRIVDEQNIVLGEDILRAFQAYADFVKPRFKEEPFVHLTVGKRALPMKVPSTTD